jgi:5'-phosphate synthase pdxT subunit
MKKIGILALQGGFAKHRDILSQLNVQTVDVRSSNDLTLIDALILPGGESTTNIKLIHTANLFASIASFAKQKPVFGTCAGSILMGREASNFPYETFNLIDVKIERNAYGTQVDSFLDSFEFLDSPIDAMFIRAPKFTTLGKDVEVLATFNSDPVIVRNNHHLMATCHPELANELAVHHYFIDSFLH